MSSPQAIQVSPTMAKFLAFFGSLDDAEAERLLRVFTRKSKQGPFTPEQWQAFGDEPECVPRPKSTEELQRLAIHADALAKLAAAREAYSTEMQAVRKESAQAERHLRGHRRAHVIQELEYRQQRANDALEEMLRMEVEARPHRQLERKLGRRLTSVYEPVGVFMDEGAPYEDYLVSSGRDA
ncbi:MAG: hypothetical protein IT303_10835 [Dehalococcoidia bacterium]|nr:hypothetical protein [Dehalococcoidia bacterium]